MFVKWFVESEIGNQEFLGDASRRVYHYPICSQAQNIEEEDRVWFSNSQEARDHGYSPCVICKPP